MTRYSHLFTILSAVCILQLTGCATTASEDAAAVASESQALPRLVRKNVSKSIAADTTASIALNNGISLYNDGSYNAAIKRLTNATEIWSADKRIQTEALKYMAFSYCVSSRKKQCKQQFKKALALDPTFALAQGEQGHPLWGPVFAQAKQGK